MRFTSAFIASAAGLALVATASAGINLIRFDFNSVSADAGGAFAGTNHTGAVNVWNDPDTSFVGAAINGNPVVPTGALSSLSAMINMVAGGTVGGGAFTVVLDQGETLTGVLGGGGAVFPQAGQGFSVDGFVFTATFSNLVGGLFFGGVNVGQFGTQFNGSYLLSAYGPNGQGFDDNANLEIYLEIPAPGAAALAGVAGIAGARRRRR